jgi:hypothetical protein
MPPITKTIHISILALPRKMALLYLVEIDWKMETEAITNLVIHWKQLMKQTSHIRGI